MTDKKLKITPNIADKELHRRFSNYGRNAKICLNKCKMLLPEIDRLLVWKSEGYGSIYEYAAKLAGMSRGMVEDALWIMRKIENKPELLEVATMKGLNRLRPIIPVVNDENAKFWAHKANIMSTSTLSTFVRDFIRSDQVRSVTNLEEPVDSYSFFGAETELVEILLKLKPDLAERLEKLKNRADFSDKFEAFLNSLSNFEDLEKPEVVKTQSHHIPVAIQNYVLKRSGEVCEFRNCNKPYKIFHHTQRFALERVHDPDQIVALCKEHERIVHLGLVEDERIPAKDWKLVLEPDRTDFKYYIDQMVARFRPG